DGDAWRGGRHASCHALDEGRIRVGQEHAANEIAGRIYEVGSKLRHEGLNFFRSPAWPELLVSVQPNQSCDAAPKPARRFCDYGAAHWVTDEDDPFETELLYDGGDIVAERLHGPRLAAESRFTMPCEIDGDDLELP